MPPLNQAEDRLIAQTLKKIGIPVHDTRDEQGRHRFLAVGVDFEHTYWKNNTAMDWFAKAAPEAKEGPDCCVTEWVATHYIDYKEMSALYDMETTRCTPSTQVWPFLSFA